MHRGITTWFYMVQYRHDVLVGRSWVRNRFGVVKKYQQKFTVFKNPPKCLIIQHSIFGVIDPITLVKTQIHPFLLGHETLFGIFNHSEKREMSEQFFFRHHFLN